MLSIDNASTRDIDDALSFEFVQGDDMPTVLPYVLLV